MLNKISKLLFIGMTLWVDWDISSQSSPVQNSGIFCFKAEDHRTSDQSSSQQEERKWSNFPHFFFSFSPWMFSPPPPPASTEKTGGTTGTALGPRGSATTERLLDTRMAGAADTELGQQDLIRAPPTPTTTARATMRALQLALDTTAAVAELGQWSNYDISRGLITFNYGHKIKLNYYSY